MAIRDVFKISRKTFFNPGAWVGYTEVKANTLVVWTTLKGLFTTPAPVREETFKQAMKRLDLTEADVKKSIHLYHMYTLLFLFFGFFTFAYAFFLLFSQGTIIGWMLGLCVSALFFSQAFRFDFWSLQMQEKKLGLTFNEWKKTRLGNKDVE